MIIQDFGGQIWAYLSKYILPEKSHLTPRGAYVLNYPPPPRGKGIYFEQLLLCFNFNMTSFNNIKYFEVKLTHFLSKNVNLAKKIQTWPLVVLMYGLTPWGKGICFEELLICFNFNMTFATIIQNIRGQIGTFLSKYAYFAENFTFYPRDVYVWTYPLEWWYFFEELLICSNLSITFVMIISDFGGQIHIFFNKIRISCRKRHIWPPGVLVYGLTHRCDGFFFEELSICFNFSMTFVMIFLDCGGQIGDFL